MRKNMMLFFAVCLLLTACRESKREEQDSTNAELADSIDSKNELKAETSDNEPMPAAADELFDDFFFNYASDRRQQQERTLFPLPIMEGQDTTYLKKRQWKMEAFFMKQDAYTVIFDSPQQIALLSDTTVANTIVERFDLDASRVEQYFFSREQGHWMLHAIRRQPLHDNPNAQFLRFYRQFTSDSVYQRHSLAEQIEFSGPDPDDDFSTIDGMITPDFWEAFRPDLPQHILYNIVYAHQDPAALQKVFLLRGIANGLEVEMTFRFRGRWRLTKLNT